MVTEQEKDRALKLLNMAMNAKNDIESEAALEAMQKELRKKQLSHEENMEKVSAEDKVRITCIDYYCNPKVDCKPFQVCTKFCAFLDGAPLECPVISLFNIRYGTDLFFDGIMAVKPHSSLIENAESKMIIQFTGNQVKRERGEIWDIPTFMVMRLKESYASFLTGAGRADYPSIGPNPMCEAILRDKLSVPKGSSGKLTYDLLHEISIYSAELFMNHQYDISYIRRTRII
jgi:hypothetical protein